MIFSICKKILMSAALFMTWNSLSIAEEIQPLSDPHDIIKKLAGIELEPVTVVPPMPVPFQAPSDWQFRGNDTGLYRFRVPYHAGILGSVEFYPVDMAPQPHDDIIRNWANAHGIIIESEITPDPAFDGMFTMTARIGGEIWKIMAYIGERQSRRLFFTARTPERWFNTYRPIFEQMLIPQTKRDIEKINDGALTVSNK